MVEEKVVISSLLKQLRLGTMTTHWEELHHKAIKEGWTSAEYLKALCEHELSSRGDRRLSRNMKEAKLPRGKSLSTFDFSVVPSLNKTQIAGFAKGCSWIEKGENILLLGRVSGCGKTHLAAAIGEGLVTVGYRVLFTRTTDLIQELQAAKKELRLTSAISKMNKYDCIIADDWGYVKKDEAETALLFELICSRYENKSLLITSNQHFTEWDKIFVNEAMAVAVVDRLIHHAHILEFNVPSYRTREAFARIKSNTSMMGQ